MAVTSIKFTLQGLTIAPASFLFQPLQPVAAPEVQPCQGQGTGKRLLLPTHDRGPMASQSVSSLRDMPVQGDAPAVVPSEAGRQGFGDALITWAMSIGTTVTEKPRPSRCPSRARGTPTPLTSTSFRN